MNPAKISGNCGRLLCCLRFESDYYRRCKSSFPSPGSRIESKHGDGTLVRVDIFNEEAVVRDEENLTFRVKAKDILSVGARGQMRGKEDSISFDDKSSTREEEQELKNLDEADDSKQGA